jgi:hypothetical protein
VFNNGEDTEKGKSSVMRILLPQNAKEKAKKTWELDLDIDTIPGKAIKYGSAELLSDGNYLICGGTNGRILEVTANKEPVWDLYLRAKTLAVFPFRIFAQYRAYYSSSLYPHYFVVSINKSNPKIIKLFNEGTDSDSYKLEFFDTPSYTISKPVTVLTTPIIKTGYSFLAESKGDSVISIKVTSLRSGIIQWYTISK